MALEPFVRSLLLGQVNPYLMALVVVDCLVIRSSRRGWLVGLAAGIKIVPGVFVLYFLLERDWRSALRAACGFLVTVGVGAVMAPQDSLRYWTGGLFGISHWRPVAVVDGKNQSLIGELARISHNPSPLILTALVLSGCGLALGVAGAHRQLRSGDEVAALTAIAIGGLLASPLSWTHHWVWAVPAVMVLVSRRRWVMAWLLGCVFAVGASRGVILEPSQEKLNLLQGAASATYVVAGLALLALWAFGPGRSAPPSAPKETSLARTGHTAGPGATSTGTSAPDRSPGPALAAPSRARRRRRPGQPGAGQRPRSRAKRPRLLTGPATPAGPASTEPSSGASAGPSAASS